MKQHQHHGASLTGSLTRLPSRRDVLCGLTGAGIGLGPLRVADTAEAKSKHHKKGKRKKKPQAPSPPATACTPRCSRKQCGDDGCGGSCGSCSAERPCLSGTCVCFSDPVSVTCAGRCTLVIDNCGDPVSCGPCPTGQQCLADGTCA